MSIIDFRLRTPLKGFLEMIMYARGSRARALGDVAFARDRVCPLSGARVDLRRSFTDMALNATIFKAALQISDMDRGYYDEHALTVARHPSETDERMMVRLLAFALHAGEGLTFGKGLSTEDEPDLWQKDLTGAISAWIDVGLPDEKRIRKACGRSAQVYVYSYGAQAPRVWWDQIEGRLGKIRNLAVLKLPPETRELAKLADRNMQLTCTIQDRQIWLSNGASSVAVEPQILKAPGGSYY